MEAILQLLLEEEYVIKYPYTLKDLRPIIQCAFFCFSDEAKIRQFIEICIHYSLGSYFGSMNMIQLARDLVVLCKK